MTRPSFSTSIASSYRLSQNDGASWGAAVTVANHRVASESVTGTNRRKPAGWIPPTPYELRRINYQRQFGFLKWRVSASNKKWWVGAINYTNVLNDWSAAYSIPSSLRDAELYNRALIKARVGMKRTSVNLGVAYAERARTAQLVSDNISSIAKAALALKRGKWRRAGRLLGITNPRKPRGSTFPKRWLEYQYGWKPLLSDIHGAIEALERRNASDWRVTSKGFATRDFEKSHLQSVSSMYRQRTNVSQTQGCFIRIDAIPKQDHIVSAASLGVTNPLLVAWELVPFSFVVDWALPVGQYLESLDAMLGYDDNHTYVSISDFRRTTWRTEFAGGGLYGATGDFGNCFRVDLHMKRSVGTTVPFPVRPYVKNPASLTRMANALSLLTQVFGR